MIVLWAALVIFVAFMFAAIVAAFMRAARRADDLDELDADELERLTRPHGNVTLRD